MLNYTTTYFWISIIFVTVLSTPSLLGRIHFDIDGLFSCGEQNFDADQWSSTFM